MTARLARAITKAASRQTYYTIRLLVDRGRVDDAYRAYAYLRWVDDVLDAESADEDAAHRRVLFLDRQKALLEACLIGDPPDDVARHERMLVDLMRGLSPAGSALTSYLRHMMLVMDFDVRRRGHLVGAADLDRYTRWLAIAVSDAMDYFIGNGCATPPDDTRYLAVTGAHVLHMLRDTFPDVRAGYFNIPREVVEAGSIGPGDVHSAAYRAWVAKRVTLARTDLDAGAAYFRRVESVRHRVAGLAYIARFEWLIDAIEQDDFTIRSRYVAPRGPRAGLGIAMTLARRLVMPRADATSAAPVGAGQGGGT
jgi:hypothetical protein